MVSDVKPVVRGAVPVLPAADMAASLAFYRDTLGFATSFAGEDYAGVERDGVAVHLFRCEDKSYAENTMVRFSVQNMEAYYAEVEPRGAVHPNGALHVTPWGTTEFTVLDPAGVCITFFELQEG